ncbi:bifunctional UDP-sugar hydrolase/5'-nucleotidase [Psychromonas sp. 14N.309.X.WAT.B.A12]|uniref:bifunctional metallophosphatase/5'-nucleotidase n=1 Tax=unclassified Psychromonas TaxID=2614957 RepID=UPI0025B01F63|nr:bifunctional metallophosphatase/5'-nucleotidase [Psychromonas sp. 14N.309.X.WAT.B.A12]MDN2664591.1 bifunctional metallophosphatase/5'-nucleotidase [Psychromonas sp. 14N.309.X.WAT.B.A12]
MQQPYFKKRYLSQIVTSVLIAASLTACNTDSSDDEQTTDTTNYTLQLLHMADMDGSNATALDNAGNFASNVDALRDQYPDNTLFLSSGDNYIPGVRYVAGSDESMTNVDGINVPGNGRADIAMVNAMGLQASAVGNHDLDGGTEEFASIIAVDDSYPGAQFPYLSSNMIFADDENTAPLVVEDGLIASEIPNSLASYTIIEVDGEQIGIVGATTPTNEIITDTGDITVLPASDDTADLAVLIQAKVDELTALGINKVILLAHMQSISIEEELATLLTDVDIIVAGGSNTLLADSTDRLWDGDTAAGEYPELFEDADGNDVALVNVDGDYKYLGRLVVEFDDNGNIIVDSIDEDVSGSYISDETMVTSLSGEANTDVDNIVDAVNDVIIESESNIVGHTDVFINGLRASVRSEETNLGNLTAEANLWYANLIDGIDTQISIKNGGGIRAEIGYAAYPAGSTSAEDLEYYPPAAYPNAGKEEGDISQYDLQTALSFNNDLTVLDLTAAQLKEIAEHAVSDVTGGRFPQISGMSLTYDETQTAREFSTVTDDDGVTTLTQTVEGERIQELAVDTNGDGEYNYTVVSGGELVDEDSMTFSVMTLTYIAEGGDGYPFPCTAAGADCSELNTDLSDIMTTEDPGNSSFADTGTEQDALAEYLLYLYPDADNAYNEADSIADETVTDERIIRSESL